MTQSGQGPAPGETASDRIHADPARQGLPLSQEIARPLRLGAVATLLLHGALAGLLLWPDPPEAGGSGGAGGTLAFEIVMQGGGQPAQEAAPPQTASPAPAAAAEPAAAPSPSPAVADEASLPPLPTGAEALLPATPALTAAAPAPPTPAQEAAAATPSGTAEAVDAASPAPPEKPLAPVAVPAPLLAAAPLAPAPSLPAAPSLAETVPAGLTAAGQTATLSEAASGGGQGDVVDSVGAETGALRDGYTSTLLGWLQQHKRYPKTAERRRQQGVVLVGFTVAPDGRVSDVALIEGSGYAALDEEALAVLRRASPLPAFPSGLARQPMSLVLPVAFTLR